MLEDCDEPSSPPHWRTRVIQRRGQKLFIATLLDSRVVPDLLSITTDGTALRDNTNPAINPVGPAPTTKTSVSMTGRSFTVTVATSHPLSLCVARSACRWCDPRFGPHGHSRCAKTLSQHLLNSAMMSSWRRTENALAGQL